VARVSEGQLKEVFADLFGLDPNTVGDETTRDTVERWDSSRHLLFVLALEEKFNVTFTEEQTLEILSYPLTRLVLEEHGIHFTRPSKAHGERGR